MSHQTVGEIDAITQARCGASPSFLTPANTPQLQDPWQCLPSSSQALGALVGADNFS